LRNQKFTINSGNKISEDLNILKKDALADLNNFVKECVDDYFYKIISPQKDVSLKITQSWCNYTRPGEFHHKHKHSNSFISGVLYVQTENKRDKIHFYNDNYKYIKIPADKYNIWNSDFWWFDVDQGDLLLFPSSISHGVERIDGKLTRISLAFNTFPFGHIGEDYAALYLRD
jgi:uncharacterized protein (TIGR02466 family)